MEAMEEIDKLVKLLKDNGFNVTTVNGPNQGMNVLCVVRRDVSLLRLDNLLENAGYEDYAVEYMVCRADGHLVASQITVQLNPKNIYGHVGEGGKWVIADPKEIELDESKIR